MGGKTFDAAALLRIPESVRYTSAMLCALASHQPARIAILADAANFELLMHQLQIMMHDANVRRRVDSLPCTTECYTVGVTKKITRARIAIRSDPANFELSMYQLQVVMQEPTICRFVYPLVSLYLLRNNLRPYRRNNKVGYLCEDYDARAHGTPLC